MLWIHFASILRLGDLVELVVFDIGTVGIESLVVGWFSVSACAVFFGGEGSS